MILRQYLFDKTPLGKWNSGAVGRKKSSHLLHDTFVTDLTAGSVDGTGAEPGPGVRDRLDDSSVDISIASGQLLMPSELSRIWYAGVPRQPGRFLVLDLSTALRVNAGWDDNQTGNAATGHAMHVTPSDVRFYDTFNFSVVATYNNETQFVFALRVAGCMFFMKQGSNWILMFITADGSESTLYPHVGTLGGGSTNIQRVQIPNTLWLPTPQLSDGFSLSTVTDGLGHSEGIAGGLGSNVDTVSWVTMVGTWTRSGGVLSASALSGGRAITIISARKADLIISAKVTIVGGTMSLIVRWVDENNFIQLRQTPTNSQLVKTVSGVDTMVHDAVVPYAAGATMTLIADGDKFRRYYNNVLVGGEYTISDAILSTQIVGVRSSNTGNTMDDLVAYARGTSGEYSILESF